MSILLLMVMLGAALFAQMVVGAVVHFWGVAPPIFAVAVLLAYSRVPLFPRMWLAAASGVVLDGVNLTPIGSYGLAFCALAVLVELWYAFIPHAATPIVRAAYISLFTFLFGIFSFFATHAWEGEGGAFSALTAVALAQILLASFLWAVTAGLLLCVLPLFYRGRRQRVAF